MKSGTVLLLFKLKAATKRAENSEGWRLSKFHDLPHLVMMCSDMSHPQQRVRVCFYRRLVTTHTHKLCFSANRISVACIADRSTEHGAAECVNHILSTTTISIVVLRPFLFTGVRRRTIFLSSASNHQEHTIAWCPQSFNSCKKKMASQKSSPQRVLSIQSHVVSGCKLFALLLFSDDTFSRQMEYNVQYSISLMLLSACRCGE